MKNAISLWQTLKSLRGNQRACVITEPLWAIPYNLFLPFASVYMAALGLQDAQIGMVASFGLVMQFLWALFSGAIVDKYGRRRTMLVFGLLSWTLPCLIWAASQGYWYFMMAVFLNSMWRVTGNCFSCLIIEDGDTGKLINIYTILNLIGITAGFITPVTGLFIDRFTLVPVMRVLYLLAMILMTAKFVLQYYLLRESETGIHRRAECGDSSLLSLTFRDWNAFLESFHQAKLLLYVVLVILITCFNIVQTTFWPLYITADYGVPASMLSVFPLVKSITTMIVFLLVTSRIRLNSVRGPLFTGLGSHLMGLTVLLVFRTYGSSALGAVFFSAICDAFGTAVLGPLYESLLSVTIPAKERARVNSLITTMILLISIPIGGIAGIFSQSNRMLPILLNSCLIIAQLLIVLYLVKDRTANFT